MISWYYMVAVACMLVLFLFYKEWTGKKRSRLYARLIASLLAVTSLLFMAYPYAEYKSSAGLNKLVLLTEGFVKDSVDEFLEANTGVPIFSDARIRKYEVKNRQLVTDWDMFATKHAADTFYVFGNGCSDEVLALLRPHPLVFRASPALPAVSNIYWKQNIEAGEQLLVQGSYEN